MKCRCGMNSVSQLLLGTHGLYMAAAAAQLWPGPSPHASRLHPVRRASSLRLAVPPLRVAVARRVGVRRCSLQSGVPDGGKDADTSRSLEQPQAARGWKQWTSNAAEMRAQVAKLGLAAVLAYGLFDGVTYTTFFVLAFLGYEKTTGNNPAANIQALLGIVVSMWAGNNVTRPFRVAGAAAIAPAVDRFLKKVQSALNLPNQAFAFMLVVAAFASLCFSIIGILVISRWGK